MFKEYTRKQRANMSLSGGGGVARYFVSGAFNQDNGLMEVDKRNNFNSNIDLKSYSLRSNVNINLTKTSELVVRLHGMFDRSEEHTSELQSLMRTSFAVSCLKKKI